MGAAEASLLDEWTNLLAIREQVFQRIEAKRQEKTIGKSLEAKICIYARGSVLDLLRRYEPVLEELLNVSKVAIVEVDPSQQLPAGDMPNATFVLLNHAIVVSPADGHKCDRCWRYYPDDSPEAVRQFGSWPNVCGRCADALRQMGYSENAP